MKKLGILLIAHGSRHAEANSDLDHVAAELRKSGREIVVASFMELAEPGILESGALCVRLGAEQVVMVPYFLSAGVHVQRDLTEARDTLDQLHSDVSFSLAEPMSRHPLLIRIVQDRIDEVARDSQ